MSKSTSLKKNPILITKTSKILKRQSIFIWPDGPLNNESNGYDIRINIAANLSHSPGKCECMQVSVQD